MLNHEHNWKCGCSHLTSQKSLWCCSSIKIKRFISSYLSLPSRNCRCLKLEMMVSSESQYTILLLPTVESSISALPGSCCYTTSYIPFFQIQKKKKKSNPTGEIETEEKTALVGEPLNHSNHSQVESLSKKGAQESNQYANQVLARRLIIISRNSKG